MGVADSGGNPFSVDSEIDTKIGSRAWKGILHDVGTIDLLPSPSSF